MATKIYDAEVFINGEKMYGYDKSLGDDHSCTVEMVRKGSNYFVTDVQYQKPKVTLISTPRSMGKSWLQKEFEKFISPKNDDWVEPLKGVPYCWFDDITEEKKYMKIKFYYNCGSTYTATGVVNYRDYRDHVYYNQEKDTGLLKTDSDIEVSKSDLLAYVVYDGNATTVVKVGNCKLNVDIEDLSKRKQKIRNVPTENGWIDWEGGECPVAKRTLVDVRHYDGAEFLGVAAGWAGSFADDWEHIGEGSDIVAYRLSKEE